MNTNYYKILLARKNIVKQIISKLNEDDWVTKLSFKAHLNDIISKIKEIEK